MEGLIQQNVVYKTSKGTPVTDSLKVAQVFGKEHKNVIRTIRGMLGSSSKLSRTEEGSANKLAHIHWFAESSYIDARGNTQPLFLMTRDGFSLLAMGLTGAKAMQFKVGFIEQFNAMERIVQEVKQAVTPAIPQTFAEALRLAANQAEQIEAQQKQLEAQASKVLFAKSVETSPSSILVGEMAKLVKQNGVDIGERRFFQWLRENGYLCQYGNRYNQPSQKAMDLGLFEIKKTTITKPNGDVMVASTTKVTGKGQIYFINKLLHNQQSKLQTT